MLYNLLYPFADYVQFLNLFKYITFRSAGAALTSLVFCFVFGPSLIRWLKVKQGKGQPIREDGPETHLLTKKGTPTMGGVMILASMVLSTLLWADIKNPYVWIVLFVTIGYGVIGFVDDFLKVTKRNTKGLNGRMKLIGQFSIALAAGIWIQTLAPAGMSQHVAIPFVKDYMLNIGFLYLPFVMMVMVGASNAVNLTDGLDGLAIVPIMIALTCFSLIAYIVGNAHFSEYLQIHGVAGTGELCVLCSAFVGAGLGFLWYNAPPAMVFMGDTGSLASGGAIGAISVITRHELVLAIIGGLFVVEALSVIVQVASFKLTGKRVFRMAPIHHHFEKLGWAEPTVVIRFWIIAFILALIGLSTLKIR